MDISYILNQLGEDHHEYFNAVSPPIVQTSNFLFDTVDDMRKAFAAEYDVFLYSRGNNPTVEILKQKIAALDGAEDALVFNSGASAIFCAVLPFVKSGDHIVSVKSPYTWAQRMFDVILPRFGVTTTYIDGTNITHWEEATRSNTVLYYLESPNSWSYELQDLAAVASLARSRSILTIIDNSYCTPLYQRPLDFGIDLSLQSATKYIGGHSDTVAGVLSGSRAHMEKIFYSEYMTTGAGATPFHAWLLLRGLRTLPARLERITRTTHEMVRWLKQQSWVTALLFPHDPGFPQYELAKKQMKDACGLLTFSVQAQTVAQVEHFCNALRRFRMAVSWGGHESLIIPKCAGMPREAFDPANPSHTQIRMYVGLEEADVLQNDLQQAAITAFL
ncbi:MAG: PLP-dependent aspartate aminotransferase family protein [Chitinophagaceae bacterium]|jgi:cystathionine beta-lyase/cystathionine gamma-synthase|nr:PLP-dependent aspartate aminotransferase family protein [Chitinophagaceae bacterium]